MPIFDRKLIELFNVCMLIAVVTGTCYASSEVPTITVVVVEPAKNDIGYTVNREGKGEKAGSTESILSELSRGFSRGHGLVVLFHPNVPVSSLTSIRSIASKVGYTDEDIQLFAFDKKRRGMIELKLSKKFVDYSADPNKFSEYFSKQ